MGISSLPMTVTRQRRGCDLNPGPTAPESSTPNPLGYSKRPFEVALFYCLLIIKKLGAAGVHGPCSLCITTQFHIMAGLTAATVRCRPLASHET